MNALPDAKREDAGLKTSAPGADPLLSPQRELADRVAAMIDEEWAELQADPKPGYRMPRATWVEGSLQYYVQKALELSPEFRALVDSHVARHEERKGGLEG